MKDLELTFAGDLILDVPQPDYWLAGIAPAFQAAHAAIGHLEVPHTRHPSEMRSDIPAPGADPAHLSALARAGLHAVSLAGNHMADCGAIGIADTIAALDAANIAHAGAGANDLAARAPCVLERGGARIALLSYNCVGPEESWATPARAGCAHIRIDTADGAPISPRAALVSPDPASLALMSEEIARAGANATLVVVSLHKGIVHTRARLAPYERAVARAAIDAGAGIVVSHHAHIVRGIEIHRGRPIYHGLGNGCVVTRALSPESSDPARAEWARRRRELFGFTPDPAYFLAPFHPEAVNAMLGRVRLRASGDMRIGFMPVHVDPPGRPRLASAAEAPGIVKYIEGITQDAGLAPLSFTLEDGCAWLH
jgi:hypothetical protein